jgi:hypothetical protein
VNKYVEEKEEEEEESGGGEKICGGRMKGK